MLGFRILRLRPSAGALSLGVWDWAWVALGPPKGLARVTQASRKGGPRIDWNEVLCFQLKMKK
jgi:hypothetical protein